MIPQKAVSGRTKTERKAKKGGGGSSEAPRSRKDKNNGKIEQREEKGEC